jgi:hypothetical protein
MPLDVLEAGVLGFARDNVDGTAPRRADAQGHNFDLMLKVLQRDDPLRRSFLQRRWQGHPVPFSREVGRYNFEHILVSMALSRR